MTNIFDRKVINQKEKNPFDTTSLGIGVNTILGIPKTFVGFGKDMLQMIARSAGSTALTIAKPFRGEDELSSSDIYSPFGQELFKNVFGDKPLKSIENRIAESELDIKKSPFAQKIGLDKQALPLAFLGVMGSITLDLSPFGGLEKNVTKKLLKETSMEGTTKILKSLKIPEETISLFAPRFAESKLSSEINDIYKMMKATMPVEMLKDAIKTSTPVRGEVENLQMIERAKRFAIASKRQIEVGGQEGYFAGLSKLKGELLEKPPTFTPLSQSLKQESIDDLFTIIQKNPTLNFGEQLTAQQGLTKLLDGHAPVPSEMRVLEEAFGSDVVRAIFDKRPLSQKIWELTGEVIADVPRALKTTLDMSATLRQGIVLGVKHPIRFQESFRQSFKQMISNNAFEYALDTMKLTPEFKIATESGLRLSDPRKLFGHREEYFLSQLAERIPVVGTFVKAANRAYVGLLNSLRFNVFNDIAKSFTVTGQSTPTNLRALADFINTGTGSGGLYGLERSATLLSKAFFAPRFMMSRVQFMNPYWYAKQPKPVRMEALKTFGTFAGTVMSIITIAKMGGADVETDWRSSNFAKMKVGNTYYDLTAGFGLYIRLIGQLTMGEKKTLSSGKIEEFGGNKPYSETRLGVLERSLRAKLAPIWSATANLLEGKSVVGEPVTLSSELLDQVTPLYVNDLVDAIKERGSGALFTVGLPAFFGVSTQTFPNKTTNPFNK